MFAFMAGLNDQVNVHRDIEKAMFMTQAARQPAVHQKADAATGSRAAMASTADASVAVTVNCCVAVSGRSGPMPASSVSIPLPHHQDITVRYYSTPDDD
jgi:hypothetical protein